MTVINTNTSSLFAQQALKISGRDMKTAMEQLSTGKQINSAQDDAAGLAIAKKMTAYVRGLDQAIRNANDGISLIQTAEGALDSVTEMMQRMRELAVQATNGTYTAQDRGYLNEEFQQLKAEINRVAKMTEFNTQSVLDGGINGDGKYVFQVGAYEDQTISIEIPSFTTTQDVKGPPEFSTGTATKATSQAGQTGSAGSSVLSTGVTFEEVTQPGQAAHTPIYSSGSASQSSVAAQTTSSNGAVHRAVLVTGQPAVAAVPPNAGQAQVSTLTIGGALFAAGDTIGITLSGVGSSASSTITYTVQTGDIVTGNAAATAQNIAASIRASGNIDPTLGVTVSGTGATVTFTGQAGDAFEVDVTASVAAGGSVSGPVDVAATPTTRGTSTFSLGGSYKTGDVVTFSVNDGGAVQSHSYTVAQDGLTAAQLAANLAVAMDGELGNSTVDASGGNLVFTSKQFGANPVVSAEVSLQGAASVNLTTAPQEPDAGTPGTAAVVELATLTLQDTFFEGDQIQVEANGSTYLYAVTQADLATANPRGSIATALAALIPGATADAAAGSVAVAGAADGSAIGLDASITRAPAYTRASDTFALSGEYFTGDSLSLSINGVSVSYTVAAGNTLSDIAQGLAVAAQATWPAGTDLQFSAGSKVTRSVPC